MKEIFLALLITNAFVPATAQTISRINLAADGNISLIIGLDEDVFLYLTKDGNLSKWGFDKYAASGVENYRDAVVNYEGRTEYYTDNDDAALRGKVKYIGKTMVTWYASYDNDAQRGKIKSIGNINFDYYQGYENEAFRGNIKNIGQKGVTWYSSFDNKAIKGKLKSLGTTNFTWYTSLDDVATSGKIKNIGAASFTWYSSFDRSEYRGSMKSGAPAQYVNGIKYIIRN